ncbi:hypothetical protein CO172_03795 [Candidatus Uhrbacteria bacterium CG_4_9_14_3_um_filter_36_7]|uniref:DUF218 domain-containing protein n=1 Tax=Candidatus Uhrbacteria bacterium CG_4_9_14_3_um_filter_36_7 TaxID=1975033 RepID=A0A2M7XEQ9_9BACT|nr:MAG: hypothetical protein CO172_03795 [Candidatus Uhrbacteria bacterium CG_4_9_14_3_um_filter_36_7]
MRFIGGRCETVSYTGGTKLNREQILEAMEKHVEVNRVLVERAGQDWEGALEYILWSSTSRLDAFIELARVDPKGSTVMWTETDGVGGVDHVLRVLRETEAHVVISGGDLGSEDTRDNWPAHMMYQHLLSQEPCLSMNRVTIDAKSGHTGWQARILSRLLSAYGTKNFCVVGPLYHMYRLISTLVEGVDRWSDDEQKNMFWFPAPFGDWETRHRCKMPHPDTGLSQKGFTYGELAFVPGESMPRFRFEDKSAENTSEFWKWLEGMSRTDLMCSHARVERCLALRTIL